ncbi:uncharacterized protein BO96DRAFT_220567 [Aspergillus niger CBS 101883]|uniref:Uncharacterized protein n=1 Tax=Aspergillus niger ATCC 13496 TaxID=1353008 RepID=A0A370C257_ASPNG|nr:uncharacterized protein BO96DRAFT_220567 [Aspergillus niger CBS 101883]PYH50778.1 hypothetical protein BO96DRAFT_220567 [Aspergillus niger CBS 101883]RDH19969.1 hypothetical protein M747DRAFT_44674 [Aspergillus niger ATCC 13496]
MRYELCIHCVRPPLLSVANQTLPTTSGSRLRPAQGTTYCVSSTPQRRRRDLTGPGGCRWRASATWIVPYLTVCQVQGR